MVNVMVAILCTIRWRNENLCCPVGPHWKENICQWQVFLGPTGQSMAATPPYMCRAQSAHAQAHFFSLVFMVVFHRVSSKETF